MGFPRYSRDLILTVTRGRKFLDLSYAYFVLLLSRSSSTNPERRGRGIACSLSQFERYFGLFPSERTGLLQAKHISLCLSYRHLVF